MKISDTTILLVDDDEEIILQLKKILENVGANVMTAASVPEALDKIKHSKPHLIVTDIEMEPVSGYYFVHKIRGDNTLHDIPIVVLSAHSEKDIVQKIVSLSVQSYILKPIVASEFLRKVRRAIKDVDFLKFDFTSQLAPTVRVSIPAEMHSIGDIGCRIESSVCLDACKDILLRGSHAGIAHASRIRFLIHKKGQAHLNGRYLSELIAVPSDTEFMNMKKELTE